MSMTKPHMTRPVDPDYLIGYLFKQYYSRIYNVCVRLLDSREEAEDITQDVFVKAYKAYGNFRWESELGTWLFRIAVNLCLNHQRRGKRRRWMSLDVFEDNSEVYVIPDRSLQPDEAVQKSELERIVQKAINRLPGRQRVALILSRYEELSYKQIAETMNCSIPAVESLLHHAKQNLVKRLRPYKNQL